MKNYIKFGTVAIVLMVFTSVLASNGTDDVPTRLADRDLKVVQAGELIYQSNCAGCHGQYLEGQPNWRTRDANGLLPAPPHDETGHTWHHADDLLFEITKYGPSVVIGDPEYKTSMPVYEGILSDDEIIAVLSFIKNTWPEEQREWQEQANGTQRDAITEAPKKKQSIIDRLLK